MSDDSVTERRILIVEDESDFAALLCSILVKAGYMVSTACNGEEAFAEVQRTRPDLITLDIQMPRQSGAHFYRKLKSNEQYEAIPVVVVTGLTRDDRDMEHVLHRFLETEHIPHPEAYVEKPIEESDLLEAIERAISLNMADRW